ncbi:ectonucleotide pyrophosphatase/phosphodiesterase [Rhodanobacter sp. L36]|uniref:alkaline phosphatase family protein n=1 Tax=Rhodanobacter sp. L36 TaxID=1747221 RepID=UPI00131EA866|nr:ectonucleotide pyrophosphatase/phosphodiesterase [Rhodanobacter sp. L36]
MKNPFRLLLCLTAALTAGCATQKLSVPHASDASEHAKRPVPLLLISIDAYRHDYIDRGLSPTLAMLANTGVRAASMQPSFPSLTFPNHYTIVTGLRPDHHGVVNNMMTDPVLGSFSMGNRKAVSDGRWWAQGTPIWETADAHGLRTATMFWPGTEADIHGHHPDEWKPFDIQETADQRVDQVLAWFDRPADGRPDFTTLYFDAVDHAGHEFGPDSVQVNNALRETDAAIARLVQGLKQRGLFERMNMIVLSDHGMAAVAPSHLIVIDKLLPLDEVEMVATGVLAGFNPKNQSTDAMMKFAAIERTMARPQQHMQCWDKTRVPARFIYGHNPRVPQLLCLADAGWHITTASKLAEKKPNLGEHGYDNSTPAMQALFVAHGPAFRVDAKVDAFPNVDVYPLMTHLLGIPPAANDGDYDAVKDMLKPSAR